MMMLMMAMAMMVLSLSHLLLCARAHVLLHTFSCCCCYRYYYYTGTRDYSFTASTREVGGVARCACTGHQTPRTHTVENRTRLNATTTLTGVTAAAPRTRWRRRRLIFVTDFLSLDARSTPHLLLLLLLLLLLRSLKCTHTLVHRDTNTLTN
uniref:Putative secreted protein n=1 Tax=Anopheles triannulatus TaxID=58253 RepID=A0A2M4B0Q1_9DIPT